METMFRVGNIGLAGRMNKSGAVEFPDFTDRQLLEKFSQMCSELQIHASVSVKRFGIKRLAKMRSLPNFANARAVDALVRRSISCMYSRADHGKVLIESDIDKDFGESSDPLALLKELEAYGHSFYSEIETLCYAVKTTMEEGRYTEIGHFIFTGASFLEFAL